MMLAVGLLEQRGPCTSVHLDRRECCAAGPSCRRARECGGELELRRDAAHPPDSRNRSVSARWPHLDEGCQSTNHGSRTSVFEGDPSRTRREDLCAADLAGRAEWSCRASLFAVERRSYHGRAHRRAARRAASDLSVEPGFRGSRSPATRVQTRGSATGSSPSSTASACKGPAWRRPGRGRATRRRNISLTGQIEGHRQTVPRDHRRAEPRLDAGTRREFDDQLLARDLVGRRPKERHARHASPGGVSTSPVWGTVPHTSSDYPSQAIRGSERWERSKSSRRR